DTILGFGVDVACEDLSASSQALCLSRCSRCRVVRSLSVLPHSAREVLGGRVRRMLGSSVVRVLWDLGCGCDVIGGGKGAGACTSGWAITRAVWVT
uniref:Uncharacterized protein n=1 Tax=Romanomermis culicivorax TaxID=13658 RepID=A0A915J1Y3_ROMCU